MESIAVGVRINTYGNTQPCLYSEQFIYSQRQPPQEHPANVPDVCGHAPHRSKSCCS